MEQQNPNGTPWTGDSAPRDTATGTAGIGVTNATDSGICPHCGNPMVPNRGLEQLLSRLGLDETMIHNLKSQFKDVDIDEYLNTAQEYLKSSGNKATAYAKEHPGKIAAGAAALAFGAGLIFASISRERD